MHRPLVAFSLSLTLLAATLSSASAADPQLEKIRAKSLQYLRANQSADGSWSASKGPAITALCVMSMLDNGVPSSDPVVNRGLNYLLKFAQPSGGVHGPQSLYRNYETSVALLCFTKANEGGRYDKQIAAADKFLKGLQWGGAESIDESNPAYGGGGYGKHKRPDLSNTGFLVDALTASGNDADSDAMKRALLFISRCQNLETEHNTTKFPALNPDGGFYYTPAAGGSSQAGKTANGGLRSYGSMTYQGLKSMIYAGVGPEDQRVKAAYSWIQKHYDLKTNPGMGDSGLFYYYHTFAKALAALKVDEVEAADGTKHNWRRELVEELGRRQRGDGSFTNKNERWLESDPNLVTAYSLLALSYCD